MCSLISACIWLLAGCMSVTGAVAANATKAKRGESESVSTYAPPKQPVQTQTNSWPRLIDAKRGLMAEHSKVQVKCLKPELVAMIHRLEKKYGKKPIISSGYRSPSYNKRVHGAKRSKHMTCEAVDIWIPGVSKWALAKHVRALPDRGGVGTYCRSKFIHIDIGNRRDWNWGCRKSQKKPKA